MNTALRLKIEMVVRVRDFLRAHSFGAATTGDTLTTQFGEKVDRLIALRDQQVRGSQSLASAVARRSDLRRKIRGLYLRQVADAAKVATVVDPELAHHCALPPANCSEQTFLAMLRTMVASALAGREVLMAHGLLASVLDELPAIAGEYEEQILQGNAARRASTGATMELAALSSELVRTVKQLDTMVRYTFQSKPELVGAWVSVRNIAWPAPGTEPKVDAA